MAVITGEEATKLNLMWKASKKTFQHIFIRQIMVALLACKYQADVNTLMNAKFNKEQVYVTSKEDDYQAGDHSWRQTNNTG